MLVHLEAESFRNLAPLAWAPGPGRHLVLGGNGAGKTSLIEAVYAAATTRSFRTARLAECIRHGAPGLRLAAEVEGRARSALAVSCSPAGLERTVNGRRVALAEHLAALPVVAWTSGDAALVGGAPAGRRRFLDRGVVSLRPGALAVLRRFRDALAEKRNLLVRLRHGAAADAASLEAWNRVLAAAAAELAGLRAAYAGELARELREVLGATGLHLPPVGLAYRPSPAAALEGERALAERLGRAAAAERRRGVPLLGPHRDELELRWGEHPAGEVASAGERKLLSLALAAAHGRVLARAGREPVHLLDDLDAELAPATVAAVWQMFTGAGQLVATSSRPGAWRELAVEHRWQVVAGGLGERNSDPL